MTQPTFTWSQDVNLPVSGRSPAARHASASGAQAAQPRRTERIDQILRVFRRAYFAKFSMGEVAAILGVEQHCLSSAWDAMKQCGWLEETGTFREYRSPRTMRKVKQQYHVLTERGQAIVNAGEGRDRS